MHVPIYLVCGTSCTECFGMFILRLILVRSCNSREAATNLSLLKEHWKHVTNWRSMLIVKLDVKTSLKVMQKKKGCSTKKIQCTYVKDVNRRQVNVLWFIDSISIGFSSRTRLSFHNFFFFKREISMWVLSYGKIREEKGIETCFPPVCSWLSKRFC